MIAHGTKICWISPAPGAADVLEHQDIACSCMISQHSHVIHFCHRACWFFCFAWNE